MAKQSRKRLNAFCNKNYLNQISNRHNNRHNNRLALKGIAQTLD